MSNTQNTVAQLQELVHSTLTGVVSDAKANTDQVRSYLAQRTATLSLLVGQAGFQDAAEAEARNVAMMALLGTIAEADKLDQRVVGIITGGLMLAARVV